MKKTILSIKALLASGLMLVGVVGNAQNYPFPQNVAYPFGYKPSATETAMSNAAQASYTSWKSAYLIDGPSCAGAGTKRVKFDAVSGRFGISGDNSIATVSEGIAYGMLMAAYAGEKTNFDGLWAYYKKFVNGNGIMNWGVNNTACTIIGQNGATDAELDVAWALYIASWQFDAGSVNSAYLTDAKKLIKAVKDFEVDKTGGLNTLKPGDQFGGHGSGNNNLVNISYFSPMYYRVFGEITNDVAFWESVYDRGYDIMEKGMNKSTGLVPDWCTSTGTVPASGATQYDDGGVNFFYDAIRTPVRVALDYLWYGDAAPRALAYTKTINNWLRAKHPNPVDIGSKYSLTGDRLQSFHNNTFVGAFAVSSMATDDANTRAYITSLYNENVKVNAGAGEYFNASWKAISLFIISGNFYLPPPDLCDSPFLDSEYNLCSSTASPKSIVLDCNLDGANKYEWRRVGSTSVIGTSKTLSVQAEGLYEVTTTINVGGKACVRRAATVVHPALPKASFTFTRNALAVDFKNTSTGGDLLAEVPSLTSSWNFGNSATPLTSTTVDGATNYGSGGSKLVTLVVTNKCGQTSSFSETVPLLAGSGPGWFATDFTSDSPGLLASFISPGVVNPNITVTKNCQFGRAEIKVANVQDKTLAITFKNGATDAPIDVTAYPYARFRIRINATTYPFVTTNGLRVDLVDKTYLASGAAPSGNSVVYLKGPRNADGTYQPIPLNTWFVSTLSFEDAIAKYAAFDEKSVLQLAFVPYNDYPTSTGRVPYSIEIDWATVGNADIPKPAPSLNSGTLYACEDNPLRQITGLDLDSCNVESVLWSDGNTSFTRTLGVGTYTVTVRNFAGAESRTVTIGVTEKVNAALTYGIVNPNPGAGTFQIQPYDNSTGRISSWRWHRTLTPTGTVSTAFGTGAGNTFLYSSTISNPQQFPNPSPISGRPTSAIFTGATTEYLCLVAVPVVSGCFTTNRACVQVLPSGPLAVDEETTGSTFAIYPTVVTDNKLNVQLGTSLQGAYEVQVMNVSGKQVASSKAISGKNEITLDSNLPAGTYIVKVSQGDKTFTERFIKQ